MFRAKLSQIPFARVKKKESERKKEKGESIMLSRVANRGKLQIARRHSAADSARQIARARSTGSRSAQPRGKHAARKLRRRHVARRRGKARRLIFLPPPRLSPPRPAARACSYHRQRTSTTCPRRTASHFRADEEDLPDYRVRYLRSRRTTRCVANKTTNRSASAPVRTRRDAIVINEKSNGSTVSRLAAYCDRPSGRSTGAPRLGRPRTETPELCRWRRRVFGAETREKIRDRVPRVHLFFLFFFLFLSFPRARLHLSIYLFLSAEASPSRWKSSFRRSSFDFVDHFFVYSAR